MTGRRLVGVLVAVAMTGAGSVAGIPDWVAGDQALQTTVAGLVFTAATGGLTDDFVVQNVAVSGSTPGSRRGRNRPRSQGEVADLHRHQR